MHLLKSALALPLLFALPCQCLDVPRDSGPTPLTFPELVTLAAVDPIPNNLETKLNVLLTTPFVHNAASVTPPRHQRSLRVAEWNINRGEREHDVSLALANKQAYLSAANRPGVDRQDLDELSSELDALQSTDVVILDEVDDGVDRTKYRNVAHDLAQALNMNYAYAVEFIELNRMYMGEEKSEAVEAHHSGPEDNFGLDPKRYLGLEGSAILSRYPIRSARVVRLPQEYDWYHGEVQVLSNIEKARRWTADHVFDEEIKRQVRRGGRMALLVDLEVPGSPTGIVTVVCPHLEDYCGPKGRRHQMEALLPQIAENRNPVILGGDMNTIGHNGRPLTPGRALRRYILNYRFFARQALYFFLPVPAAGELFHAANYFKNFHDPTAFNVPLVLGNPSRKFFDNVRAFRFADGGRFSFDGNRERSFGKKGSTLADSNGRAWKGFRTTFRYNRTYGGFFGAFKIDWFFIKPANGNAALVPEFGRTLRLVNTALGDRISDHAPIVVTLPLHPAIQTAALRSHSGARRATRAAVRQ